MPSNFGTTEFNHSGGDRILDGKPDKGRIEREQLFVHNFGLRRDIHEMNAVTVAAAFVGPLSARGVDQDPSHRFGRGGKKVAAILPLWFVGRADQSEIRFMDEGCGLKCLIGGLVRHPSSGEFPQLVVDEREQLGRGVRIAGLHGSEDLRHVRHAR